MKNFQQLDTTCGEYTRALFNVYTTSNHFNAIAKDKQWVAIATVPYEYFMGQTSPEGVCDKAFSLFHWGGSIFNKNILYHVNTDEMLNLLDVQDSGQIPQWINENKKSRFVDKDLLDVFHKFASVFPEEVNAKVDQKKVADAKSKRSQKLQKVIGQRGGGGGGWAQQQARQQQPAPQAADLLSQQMDVLGINLGKKF